MIPSFFSFIFWSFLLIPLVVPFLNNSTLRCHPSTLRLFELIYNGTRPQYRASSLLYLLEVFIISTVLSQPSLDDRRLCSLNKARMSLDPMTL